MSDSEKYNTILSGLHDEEEYDSEDPYFGIGGAIFLYWSYNNKLLNKKMLKLVGLYADSVTLTKHQEFIDMMKNSIGNVFWAEFFNKESIDFAVDYFSFRKVIWKYRLINDFEEMYSELRTYSEIPETKEEYMKIFRLFDKRYKEYQTRKTDA